MRTGLKLGRILGIELWLDWSWLLIFLLITWNLSLSFGQLNPDWGMGMVLLTAVSAALLFFASVLAHEMAHSLMAIRQGVPVRSITLFLFGGVSNIQREPPSPRAEFWITIVGPLTSFALGISFLLLANLNLNRVMGDINAVVRSIGPLTTMLLWLGSTNILLGIFNLIPGFPLDGGRILRSILWAAADDLRKATRWASWVGQAVAWLLIAAGIAMIFGVHVPFFGTGFVGGLWLAFIGWFLNSAAVSSYQQLVIRDTLEDVPVTDIMLKNPPTVSSEITIDSLVYEYIMQTDDYAFPVVEADRLVGLVTLSDVRSTERSLWPTTRVQDIMTPVAQLVTVSPQYDASRALRLLSEHDIRQLPVVQEGRLNGLLLRRDIVRWLQLQADIGDGLVPGRSVRSGA